MSQSESSKMRLKVLVRLRPTPEGYPSLVHSDHRVLYMKDPLRGHSSEFVFDNVFGPDAKQDAVFAEAGMPLVEHVMQGYNACCMAYGHTGSGKTYSMLGKEPAAAGAGEQLDPSDFGVIPRACEMLAKAASIANRKADHVETSGNGVPVRIKLFVRWV
jgi:kinesin family protein 5